MLCTPSHCFALLCALQIATAAPIFLGAAVVAVGGLASLGASSQAVKAQVHGLLGRALRREEISALGPGASRWTTTPPATTGDHQRLEAKCFIHKINSWTNRFKLKEFCELLCRSPPTRRFLGKNSSAA